MKIIYLDVPPGQAGERADVFIAVSVPELTRSGTEKLLRGGGVLFCGKALKKNYRLRGGERLEVRLEDPAPLEAQAQAIPLDVVYEDDDVIVVNKPRGMVVHPGAGNPDKTVVNALLAHCGGSLSGIGGKLRPGIVHRIDKDTSGLLISAKNDKAHESLSAQLKDRSLSRIYDAMLIGSLKQDSGTVDAPVARHPAQRRKMAVVPGGRNAVTHYRVVARYPGYVHVRFELETGRTHQIRVHAAHIGHPVAGDALYGPKNDKTGLGGQCLHASRLKFIHPRSGEKIELCCPLPDYFKEFLRKIGDTN